MVIDERHLTINHIGNAMSISRERVEDILHKELGMWEVSARWMPRLLIPDQKPYQTVMSQANLAMFEADADGVVERFLTQDKCWVHHFKPDTKRQSMQ